MFFHLLGINWSSGRDNRRSHNDWLLSLWAWMDRKKPNSSRIRSAGYDPKSQVLEVEFSGGKLIQYSGVSLEVNRELMRSPSPVSFFEDKIAEDFREMRLR